MKRIFLTRRRRYLLHVALASVAAAVLLPQAALARPDEGVRAQVDPYATDSISAEDAHGVSAGAGFVLPATDRSALDQATAGAGSVFRADDFAPPRGVTVADASTTASSVEWEQVSLFSALAVFLIAGVLVLTVLMNRRGPRIAAS